MGRLEQVTERVKMLVRRNAAAYEVVRRRRARQQERDYIARRDAFSATGGAVFSPPGYLARSKYLLGSGWSGPAIRKEAIEDVRVFGILADDPGGPQLFRPLRADFDAVLIDLAEYRDLEEIRGSGPFEWRERLQRDLVKAFEAAHSEAPVDLVFAYASHLELEPATLQRIRSSGVPVAVLCLDDKHLFSPNPNLGYPNGQQPLIGAVDVHLTNSLECVRWYLANGAATYYMPQGIDPELYQPVTGEPYIDVSFMGQRYGFRGRFISALRSSGIDIECFGPGWGRVVSHAEKVEIYGRSRINLGMGGVAYSDRLTCIKGRDFEVPAAGGLYLTTYDAELAGLFDIGREILCYRDELDCVEQIRYYLENTEEADAIAHAGRDRTLRNHTWRARMTSLMRWLGILSPGTADAPRPANAAP